VVSTPTKGWLATALHLTVLTAMRPIINQTACAGLQINSDNDDVVHARANVIKTLATVSLFFVFCWAWNQTYYLMYYLGYQHVDFTSAFYNFTVIMVFLNCCVNPVIYSIRYDQVHDVDADILKWSSGKSQITLRYLVRSLSTTSFEPDSVMEFGREPASSC